MSDSIDWASDQADERREMFREMDEKEAFSKLTRAGRINHYLAKIDKLLKPDDDIRIRIMVPECGKIADRMEDDGK